MKKLLAVAISGLLLAGCTSTTPTTETNGTTDTTQTSTEMTATTTPPVTIPLSAVKTSGQTGTATFTDLGDGKTKVVLSLTGGNFTGAQPAHIHVGTCTKPGDVKYPLTDVVNGMSETVVDAPMSSLWTGGMLVNVHKSAKEITVYTACGDLVAPTSSPVSGTTQQGY